MKIVFFKMADFDSIRNKTLLFFLDHLMGKGQPRSLHDLSCQFGAKGFTKEMRQIAGGSQSGLKKFLQQFPSLFSIDGDNVTITPLTSDPNGIASRDYTRETVAFFSDKLLTYGNAEVPLKSLFGHRSQASSEIRHVSGQNVKEFKDFLHAHTDTFIVRDDYIVLKSVLDKLEQDGHSEVLKRMPEEICFDPYLMQQLVTELEDTMFSLTDQYSNKISIDFLFSTLQTRTSMSLWNNFIKHPSDLITFLHMNSRVFLVQANMVSLTADREQALCEKKGLDKENKEKEPNGSQTSNLTEPQPIINESSQKVQAPVNSSPAPAPSLSSSGKAEAKAKTFNQRLRSQIIKVVAENSQIDSRNCMNSNYMTDGADSLQNQPSDSFYDSLDLQLIKPKIVVTSKECEEVIADVFENCTEVALDLEGINLGASGEITLIQIAFIYAKDFAEFSETNRNLVPKIYMFDVLLNRQLIEIGLRRLLESTQIVKVAHDVRNLSVSLNKNFEITLNSVFDTQVAHLILQQQTTGKPAYKPTKYISLYTLCSLYGGPNLNAKTKDRMHKIYRKDFKYWQRRPLSEEMVQFAITDVYALLPSVYRNMRDQIRPEYEPLFKQLTHESIFTYIHSDEIKQIKRQRKFELELTDLKLKLFNNEKKKIVLSNREIRLLRYIDLTEEIRNKIEGPQNVAKKLRRFDSRKSNGNEGCAEQNNETKHHGGFGKASASVTTDDGKLAAKLNSCYLSEEDLDELDYEELDEDDIDEEDTENDSLNSSLKSHEYLLDTNANSPHDSLTATRARACFCACHSRHGSAGAKPSKHNGDTSNATVDLSSNKKRPIVGKSFCDMATQTLSTGDIVITKIYFKDAEDQAKPKDELPPL